MGLAHGRLRGRSRRRWLLWPIGGAGLFADKPTPTGGAEGHGVSNPRCNKTRTWRVLFCFVFGGPVAIREDVILVFRFDRLELAVGEAGGLSAHEKYSMTPFGIPKISAGESGIPLGIPKRLELKKPLRSPVALKPLISLDFRHKKRRPWTSLDDEVGRGNLN